MHAAPPFQMIVRRFGVWRFAVCATVAATALVLGSWALRAALWHPTMLGIALVVLAVCGGSMLVHLRRLQPVSLRWDTQRWQLGPAPSAGHEPVAGSLSVAIDLGGWMLLRFVPEVGAARRRGIWLPVQRRGHEPAWSALRATVYCARPVSLPIAAPF